MRGQEISCALFVCVLLAGAETAEDLARQGREFKAKGDAASALRAFERAASRDPNSAAIQDEIGFLLAALNRRTEAIPHLEKAVALDAKFAPAHYHLGVAYWLEGNPDRSVAELLAATRLGPSDAEYRFRLGS